MELLDMASTQLLFPHLCDVCRLVYLTADSATELDDLEEGSIYIIGGLVDHNK